MFNLRHTMLGAAISFAAALAPVKEAADKLLPVRLVHGRYRGQVRNCAGWVGRYAEMPIPGKRGKLKGYKRDHQARR